MNKIFVIFTGGTGGHVLPAVAFGNYLLKNGNECILLTDHRGIKYTNEFTGTIKIIHSSHLGGNLYFKSKSIFKLIIGFFESFIFLFKRKPNYAISFGSYASLPPCFAVTILRILFNIKLYIHEQNSIIGRTNKYFISISSKFFVNFDTEYSLKNKHKNKIKVVGLPRIKNISKKDTNIFSKINKKFTFFVYGGSQGSIDIIKFLEKILSSIHKKDLNKFFFVVQSPNYYSEKLKTKLKKFNVDCEIRDFYYNLDELLQNTDIIISRCGAGTINDIIFYKIPSILIPLPSAKDNHQYENANFIIKKKCGILIDQNNFNTANVIKFIKEILNDKKAKQNIRNILNKEIILDSNKLMLNSIENENK